jgi:hypothetical protein
MAPPTRLLHPSLLAATARTALIGHAAPRRTTYRAHDFGSCRTLNRPGRVPGVAIKSVVDDLALRAMVPHQVCLGVDVVHGQPMLRPDRAGQIHPQPPGLLRRQGGEMPLSDVRVGAADPVEAIEPGGARARRY